MSLHFRQRHGVSPSLPCSVPQLIFHHERFSGSPTTFTQFATVSRCSHGLQDKALQKEETSDPRTNNRMRQDQRAAIQ